MLEFIFIFVGEKYTNTFQTHSLKSFIKHIDYLIDSRSNNHIEIIT